MSTKMENNFTNSETKNLVNESNSFDIGMPLLLVIPDYFNIFFLLLALFGMYHGVEISHPLYSMLFVNLIIPLSASVTNICAYQIVSTERYIMISNFLNALCLQFHCNCWCVTSVIRYIYIVHENWIHNKIPIMRHQCVLAFLATLVSLVALITPGFGYGISMGNLYF